MATSCLPHVHCNSSNDRMLDFLDILLIYTNKACREAFSDPASLFKRSTRLVQALRYIDLGVPMSSFCENAGQGRLFIPRKVCNSDVFF